jgi:hypothetical protein
VKRTGQDMTPQMCIVMVGRASNGELLRRAHGVCEVFVTLDRSLEFQQNIKILSFAIVVVRARSNPVADLAPHIPHILQAANQVRQAGL